MIVRRIGSPRWTSHWNDFDVLRHDMMRLLDQFSTPGSGLNNAGVFPALNVTQDRDNFYVMSELPGVKPSDLELSAEGRTLTLSGKRETPMAEGASYHRKERSEGSFSRSISLPSDFDSERVTASLNDGVLQVTLPKPEKMKPRQISVKTA